MRTVEHNQVWAHPDGTWSTMRRDGSENFVHVSMMLKLQQAFLKLSDRLESMKEETGRS